MKVGLYFGTFNPIHVGHLIIANHMVDHTDLDEVWLVVTPLNPLKNKSSLLADYSRLDLVNIAIEDNKNLKASDVEFRLPKPSYTINTLAVLKEKYPNDQFALIMGEDNLRNLHKWKNYDRIIENHSLYVYPRALTEQERAELEPQTAITDDILANAEINVCDAPVMKVSSSYIRKAISEQKDVRYLLTEPVFNYVTDMHFYE